MLSLDPNFTSFHRLEKNRPAPTPPEGMDTFQNLFHQTMAAQEKLAGMTRDEQVAFYKQLLSSQKPDLPKRSLKCCTLIVATSSQAFHRLSNTEAAHLNTALRKIMANDEDALLLMGVQWRCSDRELRVLRLHNLEGKSFAEIADEVGNSSDESTPVTPQRIRQLYLKATLKIRSLVSFAYNQDPYHFLLFR